MYLPATDDEISSIIGYVDQQLEAIRAAPLGLTEQQARERPCRSALSVAGIVKHVTYGLRGAIDQLTDNSGPASIDEESIANYARSFVLTDEETTAGLLAEFDDVRSRYLAALAAAKPDADTLAPPAPWHGITEPQPIKVRYNLMHQIEELARHAGHIDIIREQIDGMSVPALVLTRAGAPANAFFQPYQPDPGTIDA